MVPASALAQPGALPVWSEPWVLTGYAAILAFVLHTPSAVVGAPDLAEPPLGVWVSSQQAGGQPR